MAEFVAGKSYPIETLPDDLCDDAVRTSDKWAIRRALFWNQCQGWWQQSVAQYHTDTALSPHGHMARFWSPEPPDPMTREEILAERGETVCPSCDWAVPRHGHHSCPGVRQ